jgi:hypothetical protein
MKSVIFGPTAYTVITSRGVERFAFTPADHIERKAAKLDLRDKLHASVEV